MAEPKVGIIIPFINYLMPVSLVPSNTLNLFPCFLTFCSSEILIPTHNYLPVTSSVVLSLAITDGLALITTPHWITLPSSVVFNCEVV